MMKSMRLRKFAKGGGNGMKEQKSMATNTSLGIVAFSIILLATNLRAPITSVGPLIASIRDSLQISNTVAGALTTLPLLAFAFISPFAPKLARRFGMELTLFISLVVLILGILLRSLGTIEVLFIGTLLIGLAIAIGNVLLPGLVKQKFFHRLGMMTGLYAVSMNLTAAIASGVSVPIASFRGLGWQGSLGFWGLLTLVTVLFWLPQLRQRQTPDNKMKQEPVKAATHLWRSSLAWQITIFMGLQSLIFYSVVAWIPQILFEKGLTASAAGWMVSIFQFSTLPFTFVVPIIAGRLKSQRMIVAFTASLFCIGILGVLIGDLRFILLWMVFIGIAAGSAFSLAMMFFSLRTESVQEASEVSGMAQSIGYFLAALGPLFFGLVRDMTGGWTLSLILLGVASVIILIVGLGAGKEGYVRGMD